jgi:hypothetical protein
MPRRTKAKPLKKQKQPPKKRKQTKTVEKEYEAIVTQPENKGYNVNKYLENVSKAVADSVKEEYDDESIMTKMATEQPFITPPSENRDTYDLFSRESDDSEDDQSEMADESDDSEDEIIEPRRKKKSMSFLNKMKMAHEFVQNNPELVQTGLKVGGLALGALGLKYAKNRLTPQQKQKIEYDQRNFGTKWVSSDADSVATVAEEEDFVPYFAANETLCSPYFHKDGYNIKQFIGGKYHCIVDTGESGFGWNFDPNHVNERQGALNPQLTKEFMKEHADKATELDPYMTRWAEMPSGWGPYLYYNEGQPPVMVDKKGEMLKNDKQGQVRKQTKRKMRRYVTDKVNLRGVGSKVPFELGCDHKRPFITFKKGDTLPNGQIVTEADENNRVFYCPVNYWRKSVTEGDRFADYQSYLVNPDKHIFVTGNNTKKEDNRMAWVRMPLGWSPYRDRVRQGNAKEFVEAEQEDKIRRWVHPLTMDPSDKWRYGPNYDHTLQNVEKSNYICASAPKEGFSCRHEDRLYCMDGTTTDRGCKLAGQPKNSLAMLRSLDKEPKMFMQGKVETISPPPPAQTLLEKVKRSIGLSSS